MATYEDKLRVNPPRFLQPPQASIAQPGPAHYGDISSCLSKLSQATGDRFNSAPFTKDNRSKYLGRPNNPDKVVPRKKKWISELEGNGATGP